MRVAQMYTQPVAGVMGALASIVAQIGILVDTAITTLGPDDNTAMDGVVRGMSAAGDLKDAVSAVKNEGKAPRPREPAFI